MLAERLLAKGDFDTDTEIRTLEHLKKRFGENNLHSCEASPAAYALHNGNCLGNMTILVECMKIFPHTLPPPVTKARTVLVTKARTVLAQKAFNFKQSWRLLMLLSSWSRKQLTKAPVASCAQQTVLARQCLDLPL